MAAFASPVRLVAVLIAFAAALASSAATSQAANRNEEDAIEEPEALDEPDELVDGSELERRRKAQPSRRMERFDFVTVTRNSTRTGNGSISLRIQPETPRREIRFRESDARQLPEGANPRLRLQRDRLTTSNGSLIRDVTLEFTATRDEPDGLPAHIPVNARTSLFNFDYARLQDSTQPLIARLKNALDPETQRCASEVSLGGDTEDFHDRFILLGNQFVDCNGVANRWDGDLIFADAVPQRLRQELHDFHEAVSSQFSRNLGSEPGIVFVVWRPESPDNDFRLVRSLSRTNVLLFNGPSWEQGITAQQRDELWEQVAQEQVLRRISAQIRDDAATGAAYDYLLKLARAERQHATIHLLTTGIPDWISACARAMNFKASTVNASGGKISHDCSLVVQFVYDAVIRSKSSGKDTVMSTWRSLLAEAGRRRKPGVQAGAFLDSSADARRMVQGILNGNVDWVTFGAELGKIGVQLIVTPGEPAPSVQVQSLVNFRD